MAVDSLIPVRRALMAAMKANAPLTAVVPAASIHRQVAVSPTWPFIRYGAPSGLPIRGTCLDGQDITVAIHVFAKPRKNGDLVLETAEDHAGRISSLVAAALDRRRLPLNRGTARATWTGTQLLVDGGEADAFHGVVGFRVRVMSV